MSDSFWSHELGFPGSTDDKEPSYQCRRLKRLKCLGQEDPQEKEMVTHSSILAWRSPWTEEPGSLQSVGSQRVRHNWSYLAHKHMDCSTPGFPVLHHLPEFPRLMSNELIMPSNHLIICCCLLFLPSIFPRTRVFSSELALCITWPKNWSFSFSISPSNEYSGLISFRIDWFGLLAI